MVWTSEQTGRRALRTMLNSVRTRPSSKRLLLHLTQQTHKPTYMLCNLYNYLGAIFARNKSQRYLQAVCTMWAQRIETETASKVTSSSFNWDAFEGPTTACSKNSSLLRNIHCQSAIYKLYRIGEQKTHFKTLFQNITDSGRSQASRDEKVKHTDS